MNKVILVGRLTRDPESRMSQGNMEIARFSLACQSDFVNRNGERDVEFINCVAFNRLAGTINRYCHKGTMILVQGRIRNGSYDHQDGTKRYTTDVVVDQMEFMGGRGNSDTNENPAPNDYSNAYSPNSVSQPSVETADIGEDPYKDFGEELDLSSDDLPF